MICDLLSTLYVLWLSSIQHSDYLSLSLSLLSSPTGTVVHAGHPYSPSQHRLSLLITRVQHPLGRSLSHTTPRISTAYVDLAGRSPGDSRVRQALLAILGRTCIPRLCSNVDWYGTRCHVTDIFVCLPGEGAYATAKPGSSEAKIDYQIAIVLFG